MKKDDLIRGLRGRLNDPLKKVSDEKRENGGRVFGYTCIYVPEELIHAADILPIRIFGSSHKFSLLDKHLPSNCCEFAKSIVEGFLAGDYGFLDGIVFSHCCDTLRVITDIVKKNVTISFFEQLRFPSRLEGQHTKKYVLKELQRFKIALEEYAGHRISQKAIRNSWRIYDENRALLNRLYELRKRRAGILSGSESMIVVKAGMLMRKEKHNEILKDLLNLLEEERSDEDAGTRVLVSGFINEDIQLLQLIEKAGGLVVDDDLCSGSRTIARSGTQRYRSMTTLVEELCSRKRCPCKCRQKRITEDYEDTIVARAKESGAKAVIFAFLPFCDPHLLDYPMLKRTLEQEGIATLMIEGTQTDMNSGRVQTRLEALLERLAR